MCGIFAYLKFHSKLSTKKLLNILVSGLKTLEYRGSDSSGIAVQLENGDNIIHKTTIGVDNLKNQIKKRKINSELTSYSVVKKAKIDKLEMLTDKGYSPDSTSDKYNYNHENSVYVGIAHTRWATKGKNNDQNCHPHTAEDEFTVVHNGVIENADNIRKSLESYGENFNSETDTECAVRQAKFYYTKKGAEKMKSFVNIIHKTVQSLKGQNTLVFISKHFPGEIIGVMNGSSLIVGIKLRDKNSEIKDSAEIGKKIEEIEEIFVASSSDAIFEHTHKVIYLEKGDIIHISHDIFTIYTFSKNLSNPLTVVNRKVSTINVQLYGCSKGNYDDYMSKEIFEQPKTVLQTMGGRIDFENNIIKIESLNDFWSKSTTVLRIVMIACGTSFHSALAVRNLYEKILKVPIQIEGSTDFIDRKPVIYKTDIIFFISQSGETADTLSAFKYCQEKGALCIGITNCGYSTLGRESNYTVEINAGPEISVASTKAYTSQFITLVLIALQIADSNDSEISGIKNEIIRGLYEIPSQISEILQKSANIEQFCIENFSNVNNMIILGRHIHHSTCLEGALKIKEICYIQSEGIQSGELKHGPLALVDENIICIQIIMNDSVLEKSKNAFHEIIARKGKPIIICTESIRDQFEDDIPCIIIPETTEHLQGVLATIPFQLISYFIAKQRNLNVDRPRNLAKSVTTE